MLNLIGEPTVPKSVLLAYLKTKTSQPDLEFIVSCYYDISKELAERPGYPRLNPVPFILQAMHETGFLSSWWFLEHRNMAGLGVTGTSVAGSSATKPPPVLYTDWQYNYLEKRWKQGLRFSGYIPAVYAHLYHALAYCVPATDFGSVAQFFNNRYPLALATRKGKPPARVLTDFNGSWAFPGAKYGQRIEAIYSDLLASATLKGFEMPAGSVPEAVEYVALSLAVEALNSISYYRNEAFFSDIYGKLANLARTGIVSDWPTNLEVQKEFYKIRDKLIDRANTIYPPIAARLKG
jgi:hypothetical protein